eukprot:8603784-Alexandrium_andersonii.AAC.1
MLRVTPEDGWRAVAPMLAALPASPLVLRALGHSRATREAAWVIETVRERAARTRTDIRVTSGRIETGRGRGQAGPGAPAVYAIVVQVSGPAEAE